MKRIVLSCFFVVSTFVAFGQTSTLTPEQKIADFEYFYEVLKENYPLLHVNKRLNGVDWLGNQNQYKEKLSQTKTDSAYIYTWEQIIDDLNDGHASLSVTQWYPFYLKAYKKLTVDDGIKRLQPWVDVLEQAEKKASYWSALLEEVEEEQSTEDNTQIEEKPKANVEFQIIDNDIAVMQIRTFSTMMIKKDSAKIADFYISINHCRYLVIDIQENSGGDWKYWRDNIVTPLLKDTITYNVYGVIREGVENRKFYSDFFEEAKYLTIEDKQRNMPPELFSENYYIYEYRDTIFPSEKSADFTGQIFLATSDMVFSSSEAFAGVCKATGFATIIGEQTGGDGLGGSDPIIVKLPESGILITLPVRVGLNSDGSFNPETKTLPDIEIKAANSTDRLNKIIEYIKKLNYQQLLYKWFVI